MVARLNADKQGMAWSNAVFLGMVGAYKDSQEQKLHERVMEEIDPHGQEIDNGY